MLYPALLAQATPTPVSAQAGQAAVVQAQTNWLVIAIYFGMAVGIGITMMYIP